MSKGELGPEPDPVGELEFDSPSLTAALALEVSAVQDAQGDLKGAQAHMVEEMRASQLRVGAAEERLSERERAVIDRVGGLKLVGREVSFEEGMSEGEIRTAPRLKGERRYKLPRREDLAGVQGVIVGSEVDSAPDGKPESSGLLLHVDVKGSLIPPRAFRRYLVRADETVFSIGKAPEHTDH